MKPFHVLLFFVTACYILSASETVDKKQLKSKDEAVAHRATAQLAAYYWREGNLKQAETGKFKVVIPF